MGKHRDSLFGIERAPKRKPDRQRTTTPVAGHCGGDCVVRHDLPRCVTANCGRHCIKQCEELRGFRSRPADDAPVSPRSWRYDDREADAHGANDHAQDKRKARHGCDDGGCDKRQRHEVHRHSTRDRDAGQAVTASDHVGPGLHESVLFARCCVDAASPPARERRVVPFDRVGVYAPVADLAPSRPITGIGKRCAALRARSWH